MAQAESSLGFGSSLSLVPEPARGRHGDLHLHVTGEDTKVHKATVAEPDCCQIGGCDCALSSH